MRNWTLLVVSIALMVCAQTLWKLGLAKIGTIDVSAPTVAQFAKLAKRWEIWTGLAIFGGTTLAWMDLLSRMQLSQLYPMMSLTYVFAFFVGWIWLGEAFSLTRLAGIGIICLGIYVVSLAAQT